MKLATVKWFGAYKDGKIQPYGFLQDFSKKDWFVHKNELSNKLKKEMLIGGEWVAFSPGERRGKECSINVRKLDELSEDDYISLLEEGETKKHYDLIYQNCPKEYKETLNKFIAPKIQENEELSFLYTYFSEQLLVQLLLNDVYSPQLYSYYVEVAKERVDRLVDVLMDYPEPNIQCSINKVHFLKLYPELLSKFTLNADIFNKLFDDKELFDTVFDLFKKWIRGKNNEQEVWKNLNLTPYFNFSNIREIVEQFSPFYYVYYAGRYLKTADREESTEIVQKALHYVDRLLKNEKYTLSQISFFDDVAPPLLEGEVQNGYSPLVTLKMLTKLMYKDEYVSLVIKMFELLEEEQRFHWIEQLPEQYKQNQYFYRYLEPKYVLNISWRKFKENMCEIWSYYNNHTKSLAINRLANEAYNKKSFYDGEKIRLLGTIEQNPLIKAGLLILLYAANGKPSNGQTFEWVRECIEEEIERQAMEDRSFEMYYLLPKCRYKCATYCEGRKWRKLPDGAYCPVIQKGCGGNSYYNGARLKPNMQLPYEHWSLHELFSFSHIVINVPEILSDADTYVNKLGAMVNRFIEMIDRLKCSHCGEPFKIRWDFARKLTAAYSVTRYNCKHSNGNNEHDHFIYINHCWNCKKIVDSRESRFKQDGYYVCLYCGSSHQDKNRFPPGIICPKCGTEHMEDDKNSRYKVCRKQLCGHKIRLYNTKK